MQVKDAALYHACRPPALPKPFPLPPTSGAFFQSSHSSSSFPPWEPTHNVPLPKKLFSFCFGPDLDQTLSTIHLIVKWVHYLSLWEHPDPSPPAILWNQIFIFCVFSVSLQYLRARILPVCSTWFTQDLRESLACSRHLNKKYNWWKRALSPQVLPSFKMDLWRLSSNSTQTSAGYGVPGGSLPPLNRGRKFCKAPHLSEPIPSSEKRQYLLQQITYCRG